MISYLYIFTPCNPCLQLFKSRLKDLKPPIPTHKPPAAGPVKVISAEMPSTKAIRRKLEELNS